MSSPFSFRVAPNASEAASTLPPCSWKISAAQAPTLPKPCFHNGAVSIITLSTGNLMMGPVLHGVMLIAMAVPCAFMCRQSHAVHLHMAKCITRTPEVAVQCLRLLLHSVQVIIITSRCCQRSRFWAKGMATLTMPCLVVHNELMHPTL